MEALNEFEVCFFAVVAAGAISGALARYYLGKALDGAFPWGTLIINLSGSFVIGLVYARLEFVWSHPLIKPFLAIGLLGSYTTFSTFADQAILLIEDGSVLGWVYMGVSIVLGPLAAAAGHGLGSVGASAWATGGDR